jgi:hypothetical protein
MVVVPVFALLMVKNRIIGTTNTKNTNQTVKWRTMVHAKDNVDAADVRKE